MEPDIYNWNLQVILRFEHQYTRLSPSLHPAIMDTPLFRTHRYLRTEATSPEKEKQMYENKSRYYRLPLLWNCGH